MPTYVLEEIPIPSGDLFRIKDESNHVLFTVKQTFLKSVVGLKVSKFVQLKTAFLPGVDTSSFSKLVLHTPSERPRPISVRQKLMRLQPAYVIERNNIYQGQMKEQIGMISGCFVCCCGGNQRSFKVTFGDRSPPIHVYVSGDQMDSVFIRRRHEIARTTKANDGRVYATFRTMPDQDDELLLAIAVTVETILQDRAGQKV